ncbi:hypothetical protein PFISCL1PPCAC_22099, partial [Pristionchus fissidentatus]
RRVKVPANTYSNKVNMSLEHSRFLSSRSSPNTSPAMFSGALHNGGGFIEDKEEAAESIISCFEQIVR